MQTKRDYEKAVKKCVSMPGILFDKGHDKARRMGFSAFSDYVQNLIRNDLMQETLKAGGL